MFIIELAMMAVAIYRGWRFEALGMLVLLVAAQIIMVEMHHDAQQVNLAVELIFMAVLLLMIVNPKKQPKTRTCAVCEKPLGESDFSCPHCGAALTNETQRETVSENTYTLKTILKDKNDFGRVKEMLLSQYAPHGYTNKVIDKTELFMLKNDEVQQSYVTAKMEGHDLTLEAFNIEQPRIKITSDGSLPAEQ